MDPHQAIAARYVSAARKSGAGEIDAFYEENAFERLHTVRGAVRQFERFLHATLGRTAPTAPEISSADGQA